jgi:hypothetical protein
MPTRKISLTPEQDAFIEQVVTASEYHTGARESRTGADSEEQWGAVGTRRSAPIRCAHRNSNAPSGE